MMATTFDCGVQAEEKLDGNFEVFCNWCRVSIGTMHFSAIREAIFNTLGRGGVRCPNCRFVTCDLCGIWRGGEDTHQLMAFSTSNGEIRACVDCQKFLQDLIPEGHTLCLDDVRVVRKL